MTAVPRAAWLAALLLGRALAACSADASSQNAEICAEDDPFASEVVSVEFGSGQDFGQSKLTERVLGPPRGGGCCAGSLDVTSLGEGGSVVLAFHGDIVDGPGPDFVVFENPFLPSGASPDAVFAELATVSVSLDGESWSEFPCTETEYPYGSCAGWHPVLANADKGPISTLDPELAGGDPFDLADVRLTRARYVRIHDREDLDGTFDLDAVAILNAAPCDE